MTIQILPNFHLGQEGTDDCKSMTRPAFVTWKCSSTLVYNIESGSWPQEYTGSAPLSLIWCIILTLMISLSYLKRLHCICLLWFWSICAEPVQSFESGDSVEHPSTPGKEEHTSPVQSQGYRLGTKEDYFNQGSVYDALYEEANNLLNNLHFERIQRASAN